MKKSIILLSGAFVALTACDENSWNDKYLDGFEGDPAITDVQNVDITLSADDYGTISTLATAKALAGDADAAALAALRSRKYFDETISATKYIPCLLSSSSFKYFTLSNGSSIKVTYNQAEALPEELKALEGAFQVSISKDQYQEVWGSEEDFISAFAPSHSPEKYLKNLLADRYDDAENGDYYVVSYNYSEQEPIFVAPEGGGDIDLSGYQYIRVDQVTPGQKFLMVSDGACANAPYAEGKKYGYFNVAAVETDQYGIKSLPEEITDSYFFSFETATGGYNLRDGLGYLIYGAETYNNFYYVEELPADDPGTVWKYELQDDGTMKVSNGYDKWIQYSASYSSYGCYADARGTLPAFYVQNPTYKGKPAKAPLVDVPTISCYALYQFADGVWTQPSNVAVVQPSDYEAMGSKYGNLQDNQPAQYLPEYLKQKFPYAQKKDTKYVLYRYYSGSTSLKADQYTYNGEAWILNNGIVVKSTKFLRENNEWIVAPGLAEYNYTKVTEIAEDGQYIFVANGFAATALPSKNYGYLATTEVALDEEHAFVPDDAELCVFTVTKVDGGCTIQDNAGRYVYQMGTYNSFNFDINNPGTGEVWSFDVNEDGSMKILNLSVNKYIQYDPSYSSYGSYENERGVMPTVYFYCGD